MILTTYHKLGFSAVLTVILTFSSLFFPFSLEAEPAKPIDIELWMVASISDAAPLPRDWLGYRILREKYGINLKIVMLPSTFSDQDTKVVTAAAANRLPDIVQLNRITWNKLAKTGLIAPLDAFVPLMPHSFKVLFGDNDRKRLALYDGKLFAFPATGSLQGTDGLVIRKDWLDKLKLPMPKTIDDFLKVAKAFTEQDPDGNGKADTYGFGAFIESADLTDAGLGRRFDNIFGAYGVPGVWNLDTPNQPKLNIRSPSYLQAMKTIRTIVENNWIDPDWTIMKKDDFRLRWKQGRYGMMRETFSALWSPSNYKQFDENYPEGEWVPLEPPAGPNGKRSQGLMYRDIRYLAVSARAVKQGKTEAIAKLFEWFASDEGYYLSAYGVEGQNFRLDTLGDIGTQGLIPDNTYISRLVQPYLQVRNLVYRMSETELKARYPAFRTRNGRWITPLDRYIEFNTWPSNDASPLQLFNSPPNTSDFLRTYNEGLTRFVMGQAPLNVRNWAEFIAAIDRVGAKELEGRLKQDIAANRKVTE